MGSSKLLQRCDSSGSPMGGSVPGSPTRKAGSSLRVAHSVQSSPTKKRTPRSPQHVLQRSRKVSVADDPDDSSSCDTPSSCRINSILELREKGLEGHPVTDNNQNSIHDSLAECLTSGTVQHLIIDNELDRFAGSLETTKDATALVQRLNSEHPREGSVEGAWQDDTKMQSTDNKSMPQRSFSHVAKTGASLLYRSTVGACLHARASLRNIQLRSGDFAAQSKGEAVHLSDRPSADPRPHIACKRYPTISSMRSEDLAGVAKEYSDLDEGGQPQTDQLQNSLDGDFERRNLFTHSSSNAPITNAPKKTRTSLGSNGDYPVIVCPKASPEADYENGAFTVNSGSEMITLVTTSDARWPAFPAVCCGGVVNTELLTGASKERSGSPSSGRQKRCNIV